MKRLTALIFTAICCLSVHAQESPDDLFGKDFRDWIKENYYDGHFSALSYADARKKMFAYVANDNDSIECVYSGLRQAHPYGFEITFPEPFNTEHVIPQSLFNSNEPMRADIHILQPAYQDWNSLRANFEFRELDDFSETQQWIYLDQSTGNIPTQNIDRYSEYIMFGWEPRESSKGNVARAFMYFFTVYPQFTVMDGWIDTTILCQWHEEDPVDEMELFRSDTTVTFQGNINPYINYPWFANQAWGCHVEVPVVNQPPVADDDLAETNSGESVVIDVSNGDIDPDNGLDISSITIIDSTNNGSLTVRGDGTVTYDPDPGFSGSDMFTYAICDTGMPILCDTATVVITVNLVNGVNLSERGDVAIYPNPGIGKFTIELGAAMELPVHIDVIDSKGSKAAIRQMDSIQQGFHLDLPTGTYFMIFRDKQNRSLGFAPVSIVK